MLMAVVLSFLAVTAWSATTGGCQPPKKKPPAETDAGTDGAADAGTDGTSTTDGTAPTPSDDGTPSDPNGDTPKPPGNGDIAPAKDHPHDSVEASEAWLKSTELEVLITSRGAAVRTIRMRNIFEADGKTPMDLVVDCDPDMLMGAIDNRILKPTAAPGGDNRKNQPAGQMRTLNWIRKPDVEAATPTDDVVYQMTHRGVTVRKTWSLEDGKDRYGIRLDMRAWQAGAANVSTLRVGMLASSGQLREVFRGAFGNPNNVMVYLTEQSEVDNSGLYGYPAQQISQEGVDPQKVRIFGTRSTYFMTAYYADVANGIFAPVTGLWATGEQGDLRPSMEKRAQDAFLERGLTIDDDIKFRIKEGVKQMLHAWVVVDLPVAASETSDDKPVRMDFYAGPIDRQTIAQNGYDSLKPVITYPSAPDFVAKFLLWIYDLWRGLTGSAGLAIIFMTLCVRGGLMPLSIRNQLSMRSYGRKVAKLKPKLTSIQEKYAKNPKRLREEQMKLYRENGVGFPSGCVMMLIQIPIFFALFSALRVEYTIRNEQFLWIQDLAGPDRLIDFGTTLVDLGIFRLDALNLLPILMVVLSIWHTRSMPKPADEQQAQQMKMMKWLPIFFAFILYNYTAALALYMVFSSAIALIEAKIVRAKDAEATAEAEAEAATA